MTSIFKLNTVSGMLFNCVSFFLSLVFGSLGRSLDMEAYLLVIANFHLKTTSPVPADADAVGQLLSCSVCKRDVMQTHKETFLTLEVFKTRTRVPHSCNNSVFSFVLKHIH